MIIQSGITIGSNITVGDLPTSPYLPPYLYEFLTFTFATGNTLGPTGANARWLFGNSYSNVGNTWLQSTSYYNTTGNGYQYWTVPETGNYQITAAGARSGYPTFTGNAAWSANAAGRGVTIQGTVPLTQGQVITIAVGQPSANAPSSASFSVPGGGGGTFVVFTNNNAPIIVAGGGGSPGNWTGNTFLTNGGNAVTTTWGGNSYAGAPGGFNGWGGNAHVNRNGVISLNSYDGGGGGGFYLPGAYGGPPANTRPGSTSTGSYGQGGRHFLANLVGGARTTTYNTQTSDGGFGGGGGPGPITGAGGGGYSGGGGGYGTTSTVVDSGGGGGSYIIISASNVATSDGQYETLSTFNSASITNLGSSSYNTGPGYVTILKL